VSDSAKSALALAAFVALLCFTPSWDRRTRASAPASPVRKGCGVLLLLVVLFLVVASRVREAVLFDR
jgi:hypothetical protein